jgi:hypothetical protein
MWFCHRKPDPDSSWLVVVAEMKSSLLTRQESQQVSSAIIIDAMLLWLCVLSIVKARYCGTPFSKFLFALNPCAVCLFFLS